MIQPEAAGKKITFVVIWLSMLMACVIYFIIPLFLPPPEPGNAPPVILLQLLIVLAVVNFGIGAHFLWKRTSPVGDEKSDSYISRALAPFIVGMACFEAIAIYGIVLFFLGFKDVHLYFIGAAFVLLLIAGTRISAIFSHYINIKDIEDAGGFGTWNTD